MAARKSVLRNMKPPLGLFPVKSRRNTLVVGGACGYCEQAVPVWDGVLHYYGPGGAFAPTWWTVPCISWDLLTAAYIAWRIVRGTHPARAGDTGELLPA